jgi:hypothetical protein
MRRTRRHMFVALGIALPIMASTAAVAQTTIVIRVHGDAHMLITDTTGRRSGRGAAPKAFIEIPGAESADMDWADDEDSTGQNSFSGYIFEYPQAPPGTYMARVYAEVTGQCSVVFAMYRSGGSRQGIVFTSSAFEGSIAQYRVACSPAGEFNVAALTEVREAKAALYSPNGTELRVTCRSTRSRSPAVDTLHYGVVTLRWPEGASVDLTGAVTGAYGFKQAGPVMTVNGYRYQRFCTTAKVPLSWTAGTEYELLRVPVVNPSSADIELSSAILGSEWSLQIGAEECADTVAYHPVAPGLPAVGKSTSPMATFTNGGRHIARRSGKLHQAFGSDGDVIYRRQAISGGAWEVTRRLSPGPDSNGVPSIALARGNSVHAVWQRQIGANLFELWYSRSLDDGSTWTDASPIPGTGQIPISSYQWNLYPVIAEWNSSTLVVAYVRSNGIHYVASADTGRTWSAPGRVPSAVPSRDQYVWFLSMTTAGSALSLTYDYRYYGVWSRTFNGSTWSSEANVSAGTGTTYDRYAGIGADASGIPVAAWCAQKYVNGQLDPDYRILFREGAANNTWGWFTEFPKTTGISDQYPSVSVSWRGKVPGSVTDILYQRTNLEVRTHSYSDEAGVWGHCLLSSSAQWPNISRPAGSTEAAYGLWTGQGGPPYSLTQWSAYCGGGQLEAPATVPRWEYRRRLVLQKAGSTAYIEIEVGPVRVTTETGDTMEVELKPRKRGQTLPQDPDSLWSYLETGEIDFPSSARSAILDVSVRAESPADSVTGRRESMPVLPGLSIGARADDESIALAEESAPRSGLKTVDISGLAGRRGAIGVRLRVKEDGKTDYIVTVGDVFVERRP